MNPDDKIMQLERRVSDLENIIFNLSGAKKETELYHDDPETLRNIFMFKGCDKFKASDLIDFGISETVRGIGSWISKRLNRDISGYMIVKSGRCIKTNSYYYKIKQTSELF